MLLTSCVSLQAAQLEVQIHQSPLDVRHAVEVFVKKFSVCHAFQGVHQIHLLCLTSCFMNKINKSACMCDTCLQLHHGRHDLIVLTASSFLLVLRFHCSCSCSCSSSSSLFSMNRFRYLNAQSP